MNDVESLRSLTEAHCKRAATMAASWAASANAKRAPDPDEIKRAKKLVDSYGIHLRTAASMCMGAIAVHEADVWAFSTLGFDITEHRQYVVARWTSKCASSDFWPGALGGPYTEETIERLEADRRKKEFQARPGYLQYQGMCAVADAIAHGRGSEAGL